jgi:hypothetical protein
MRRAERSRYRPEAGAGSAGRGVVRNGDRCWRGGLERALAVELDKDRSPAARTLLIGGEADLPGEGLAGSRRAVEHALGRAVAGLHQDTRGPLLAAVVVLPRIDRATADRGLVEGDLEQFEPAMPANHDSTVSGPG